MYVSVHVCVISNGVLTCASNPAVAERPCDASCLSVVDFSSTIRRAQSSIISRSTSDLLYV